MPGKPIPERKIVSVHSNKGKKHRKHIWLGKLEQYLPLVQKAMEEVIAKAAESGRPLKTEIEVVRGVQDRLEGKMSFYGVEKIVIMLVERGVNIPKKKIQRHDPNFWREIVKYHQSLPQKDRVRKTMEKFKISRDVVEYALKKIKKLGGIS